MRPVDRRRAPADWELAVLDDRLRAARREAVAAMTAIGAIIAMLAMLGRWTVV